MSFGGCTSRTEPRMKGWHEEYALSDTCESGLRYVVSGNPSCQAGCPVEITWPTANKTPAKFVHPAHFRVHVIVGWEETDLGGFSSWDTQLEEVDTYTVREILMEHAERAQQIELLEQHLHRHLQQHLEVA